MARAKHGQGWPAKTPEYTAWQNMKARCMRPNHPSYKDYGERGISVCRRWLKFESFYTDMGNRPSPKHSLERKENDGPYAPDNCEWAIPAKQSRNTRRTRLITIAGETLCAQDWADRNGLDQNTVRGRIHRGWSLERAVSEPTRSQYRGSC